MTRFYTYLQTYSTDECVPPELLERACSMYDEVRTGDSNELEKAMFNAADALDMLWTNKRPTTEVRVNTRTGNWSMTLRNPQEGLRVVITGDGGDLPVIQAKLKEWFGQNSEKGEE